jgi:hypothetical protein
MYAQKFSTTIASKGQAFTHLLQAMQAESQARFAGAPLSWFTHET